jgi:hypothetical protein
MALDGQFVPANCGLGYRLFLSILQPANIKVLNSLSS